MDAGVCAARGTVAGGHQAVQSGELVGLLLALQAAHATGRACVLLRGPFLSGCHWSCCRSAQAAGQADVLKDMIFPQCEKLGQTIIFVRTRETARALHSAARPSYLRCWVLLACQMCGPS